MEVGTSATFSCVATCQSPWLWAWAVAHGERWPHRDTLYVLLQLYRWGVHDISPLSARRRPDAMSRHARRPQNDHLDDRWLHHGDPRPWPQPPGSRPLRLCAEQLLRPQTRPQVQHEAARWLFRRVVYGAPQPRGDHRRFSDGRRTEHGPIARGSCLRISGCMIWSLNDMFIWSVGPKCRVNLPLRFKLRFRNPLTYYAWFSSMAQCLRRRSLAGGLSLIY